MTVRYITVTPITNLFKPATRAFGDIAIVGNTDVAATGPKKIPIPVTNPDSVSDPADPKNLNGRNKLKIDDPAWFPGDLAKAVRTAFDQTPGPTLVWAVRTDSADANAAIPNALAEVAKIDVQIVTLAHTPLKSAAAGTAEIEALAGHVTTVSNTGGDGKERIGVAMLDKDLTDSTLITGTMSKPRMVFVAHKSDDDVAAAVAGTIGGYEPHISLLLKQVSVNMANQFGDDEIGTLDSKHINWITRPTLIPGNGLFMGEGYTADSGTVNPMPYIDIVRTIDDISFRLKAELIQSIGNLRISRPGLRTLIAQMTSVLEPLKQRQVIDNYDVFLPLLVLLDKDPLTLLPVETQQIATARSTRVVDVIASVQYAGAIHRLNITLKFE